MRSAKILIVAFHLYSILYGISLLFLLEHTLGSAVYSLFTLNDVQSLISRLLSTLHMLVANIRYTSILIVLIFIEVLRLTIVKAKAMLLIEALLLLVYTWSLEVMLIYVTVSYLFIKLAEGFVSEYNNILKPLCDIEDSTSYQVRIKKLGLLILALGLGTFFHVLYSYSIRMNVVTIVLYIAFMAICILKNYGSYVNIGEAVEIVLISIPPFGVLISLLRSLAYRHSRSEAKRCNSN